MKFMKPGVTAVSQPAHQMGMEVARLLLGRIDGQAGPFQHLVLPARLMERGSIARVQPQRDGDEGGLPLGAMRHL